MNNIFRSFIIMLFVFVAFPFSAIHSKTDTLIFGGVAIEHTKDAFLSREYHASLWNINPNSKYVPIRVQSTLHNRYSIKSETPWVVSGVPTHAGKDILKILLRGDNGRLKSIKAHVRVWNSHNPLPDSLQNNVFMTIANTDSLVNIRFPKKPFCKNYPFHFLPAQLGAAIDSINIVEKDNYVYIHIKQNMKHPQKAFRIRVMNSNVQWFITEFIVLKERHKIDINMKNTLFVGDEIQNPAIWNLRGEVFNESSHKMIYKWNSLSGFKKEFPVLQGWLDPKLSSPQAVRITQTNGDSTLNRIFKIRNETYNNSKGESYTNAIMPNNAKYSSRNYIANDSNTVSNGQISLSFYEDHIYVEYSKEVKTAIDNCEDGFASYLFITDADSGNGYTDGGNTTSAAGGIPIPKLTNGTFSFILSTKSGDFKINCTLKNGLPVYLLNKTTLQQHTTGEYLDFIENEDIHISVYNDNLKVTLKKGAQKRLLEHDNDNDGAFISVIPIFEAKTGYEGTLDPSGVNYIPLSKVFQGKKRGAVLLLIDNGENDNSFKCIVDILDGKIRFDN